MNVSDVLPSALRGIPTARSLGASGLPASLSPDGLAAPTAVKSLRCALPVFHCSIPSHTTLTSPQHLAANPLLLRPEESWPVSIFLLDFPVHFSRNSEAHDPDSAHDACHHKRPSRPYPIINPSGTLPERRYRMPRPLLGLPNRV